MGVELRSVAIHVQVFCIGQELKECVGLTDAEHDNKEYIDINRATTEIHSRNIGTHMFMGL